MPVTHLLLALLVVVVWGANFLFVKFSLEEMSPLLLCSVRFTLASIPAIFFIRPPTVPFKILAAYGLIMFALQFALLFMGMSVGMPPGVASLIAQMQVFFSIFFAAVFLREIPYIWQVVGALVSFSGIGIVAMHFDKNISLAGLLLILAAAATWGVGNLITKKCPKANMISLVIWASFIATFPMVAITLLIEGPQSFVSSWQHVSALGISSVFYIVYISTWVGYGVWNWLLSKYPVGVVAPFTLLVPVVGMISSIIVLNEPFQIWKLFAALLVVSGLCISTFGTHYYIKKLTALNQLR